MNGEDVVQIKDLDVKIITIASERKVSIPNGVGRLYIASSFSDDYRLSSLNKTASAKYIIIGPQEIILYISMILNSYAGYVQMKDFAQNPKVNLSAIKNIKLPEVNISLLGAGAIIDMYEGMLEEVLVNMKEEGDDSLELKVLRQFLNLIHRYYVEQLYLPEFFEAHDMDIISPWLNICASQHDKIPELHNSERIAYLKSLMQALLVEEKKLFEIFNKMKVFQMETLNLLSKKLNPNYLGPLGGFLIS